MSHLQTKLYEKH